MAVLKGPPSRFDRRRHIERAAAGGDLGEDSEAHAFARGSDRSRQGRIPLVTGAAGRDTCERFGSPPLVEEPVMLIARRLARLVGVSLLLTGAAQAQAPAGL